MLGHSQVGIVNLSDICTSPHKAKKGKDLLKNAFIAS